MGTHWRQSVSSIMATEKSDAAFEWTGIAAIWLNLQKDGRKNICEILALLFPVQSFCF
jgi:hypothetical protein